MSKVSILATVLMATLAVGCASIKAPIRPDGRNISVVVHLDRGDQASMNEGQWRNRLQVGTWMENDLVNILNNAGYDGRAIAKKEDFPGGAGVYLLTVTITSYNPGSKAARMFVGLGVGATSLAVQYELAETPGTPIKKDQLSVGSSKDWNYCARTLNVRIARAITTKLHNVVLAK